MQLREASSYQWACTVQRDRIGNSRKGWLCHGVCIDQQGKGLVSGAASQHQLTGATFKTYINSIASINHRAGIARFDLLFKVCQYGRPGSGDSTAINRGHISMAVDCDGVDIAAFRQRAAELHHTHLINIPARWLGDRDTHGNLGATSLIGLAFTDMADLIAQIARSGRAGRDVLQIQRACAFNARIGQFNRRGGRGTINTDGITIQIGMGLTIVDVSRAIAWLSHIYRAIQLANRTGRVHGDNCARRFLSANRGRCFNRTHNQVLAGPDGDVLVIQHIAHILDGHCACGIDGDVATIGQHMLDNQIGRLVNDDVTRDGRVNHYRAHEGVKLHAIGGCYFQTIGDKHRCTVSGNRSCAYLQQANIGSGGLAGGNNTALEHQGMARAFHVNVHVTGRVKAAQATDKAG